MTGLGGFSLPSLKDTAPSPLLMCSNRFAAKGRGRRNQTAEHNVIFFCPFASCLCPPTLHILLPSLHILLRAFVTQSLTFPTSYRAKQTAEGARPGGCSQSRSSDQGPLPNLHLPKPQTSILIPQSSNPTYGRAGIKDSHPVLQGALYSAVSPEDCMWTIDRKVRNTNPKTFPSPRGRVPSQLEIWCLPKIDGR